MRKYLFILVIGFQSTGLMMAQDPEFTQFYANPLYLNPAFAGTNMCPRINLNYRNQWPAISGTFVTYAVSYDQHVDAFSGGIGLAVMVDDQGEGTIKTNSLSGMYSYLLPVNRHFSLKFALQATYLQKTLDWNKLTFGDMIDPAYGFIYDTKEIPGKQRLGRPDFAAGLLGYSKNYFFGFAAHHLTQPDESFTLGTAKLPRKYTGHAGAVIPFNSRHPDEGSISPNILFQQQQDFTQLNMGLYVTRGPMVGGLWYRNQDAFIVLLGLQAEMVRIGYSYDVTVSKLSNATAGSHEVSFAIMLPCRPKHRKFRQISCPSF